MSGTRVRFEAPPVVETVLSIQFERLAGYTTAHAGWFWKEYVEKLGNAPSNEWTTAAEAVRVTDRFERFGAEDVWLQPPFNVTQGVQSPRIQLIRSDGERMIQLQDTRFILNWRKQADSPYPNYETLLPEFRNMLHAFESFCAEAQFGRPTYNQWEIAYVDQVKKGDMWDSARDWSRIFSGLTLPPVSVLHVPPTGDEKMNADWRFSLADEKGRLYISLRQARLAPLNEEVLHLTSTARGPVSSTQTWEQGFTLGHEALRETFFAITSPEAQERWKKRAL